MQLALASRPATPGAVNLDWAGAAACGTAVVLDGLTEAGETGCRHGTAWYVNALGARLLAAAADPAQPLREALRLALTEVAAAHRDTCDLTHPGSPGATVALVRPGEPAGTVEYLVLADAVVVLDAGADLTVVSDNRVDGHLADLRAAATGGEQHATGQAPGALRRLIEAQQALRNRAGGYWVARADHDAADHAVAGHLTGVRAALLLSDGAALLASQFGALGWRELIDLALGQGPAAVIAATREIEARDPQRLLWPRYKTHDDATVVICDLRP